MNMNRKNKKRQYSKEAIDNAIKAVLKEGISLRQAAKKFGLPRSTIQFKMKNPNSKFKSGPDPILTATEEDALCTFILNLAKRGFPRKKEDIQLSVQTFLKNNPRRNPFKDDKPGDVWFQAFLKRHPVISKRTLEGVTSASTYASEGDIHKWFREIKKYFKEEGLTEVIKDPRRVFNADETVFNICPKTGEVLIGKGEKNITVLFTFSASGFCCDPLVIYPHKRIPDRIMSSVPAGWGIGRNNTGLMTAAVLYNYITNCFYPQLKSQDIPFPIILFVNGHRTHVTIDVLDLCRNLNIHLISLYPNYSQILQPADLAAFRPIKEGWKKGLREWSAANNYEHNLTKEMFAPLLKIILEKFIKISSLVDGFQAHGLFPFNGDNVNNTKCLNVKTDVEDGLEEDQLEVQPNLSFKDFCDIVGPRIIKQCEMATKEKFETSDQNFIIIYNLWKKFNPNNEHQELNLSNQSDYILDEQTGDFKTKSDFIDETCVEYKDNTPQGSSNSKITIQLEFDVFCNPESTDIVMA